MIRECDKCCGEKEFTEFKVCKSVHRRPQWPRGLRRRSAAARLLRSWVPIPPGAWMFVCCECSGLSGRGLCDGLITRPEESYRLWCVVVCDLETSRMRRPWPALGRSATEKKFVHHRTIQINHQPNATIFQFIILTFIYSSTCFGLFPAHLRSSMTAVLSCWWWAEKRPKHVELYINIRIIKGKSKAILLQAWTGPEISRR